MKNSASENDRLIDVCSENKKGFNKLWTLNYQKNIEYSLIKTKKIFDPGNNALLDFCGFSKKSRVFVVIDHFVANIYKSKIIKYFENSGMESIIIPFEACENNKTSSAYLEIFSKLNDFNICRRSEPILAIGGGALTDLVGFVASTYRRGIPHIKVPTTLMGYVDASVGIKTGVNFKSEKNRMGTFEPPRSVILDKTFFRTLPVRHIINGVGEILKLAVIKDETLFTLLEETGETCINNKFQDQGDEILDRSIIDMLEELEPNLYEDNLERIVDFGHTFSPIMEMIEENNLLHGEAVAVDVVFSSVLSFKKGLLSLENLDRILKLANKLGLPSRCKILEPNLLWNGLIERTAHRGGKQRIPLPVGIGKCEFLNDITMNDLKISHKFIVENIVKGDNHV